MRLLVGGAGVDGLAKGLLYGSAGFLSVQDYRNVNRWADEIGARLGVGETTVSHWALRERVATTTATKVARLYEELWDQPGPSTRTRQRAERLKWAPPLAWDDGTGPHGIDNPKARPYPWKRRDSDRRRSHDISDLRAAGLTDTEIAHRLGIQPESLQRRHAA